jgi:hypothetical protein
MAKTSILLHIGQRFGRLTILDLYKEGCRKVAKCLCDCGNETVVKNYALGKKANSCGCYRTDLPSITKTTHGHNKQRTRTPTYNSWRAMKDRCNRSTYYLYKDYGGRGIKICERWNSFANFLADMGERPENKTLDRIDVNGNYGPENCKWSDVYEQNRNKRNSKRKTT